MYIRIYIYIYIHIYIYIYIYYISYVYIIYVYIGYRGKKCLQGKKAMWPPAYYQSTNGFEP